MDFQSQPKKPRAESIVPMINVVFLLLVFFLMTATLSQPDPFEIVLPVSGKAGDPESVLKLYVGKENAIQFQDHKGEAAFAALKTQSYRASLVQVRVDATLDGDRLAQVLEHLADAGFASIEVVVDLK
jgi:biopolymer transport protein ExbD